MDYNLYWGGGAGPDVHRITANPQFINAGSYQPDLSLQILGTMDYNLYYGSGAGADMHKITADPLFTYPDSNPPDIRLQTSSPAKNAGDPSFVLGVGETDFVGKARVVGGRIDIGVYEIQ